MATPDTPDFMVITLDPKVVADLAVAVVDELERRAKARDAALIASHEGTSPSPASIARLARQLFPPPGSRLFGQHDPACTCGCTAATCGACGGEIPAGVARFPGRLSVPTLGGPDAVHDVVLCALCAIGPDNETAALA